MTSLARRRAYLLEPDILSLARRRAYLLVPDILSLARRRAYLLVPDILVESFDGSGGTHEVFLGLEKGSDA